MYTLLPLVIILVAFWFLLIRPQQKRQAQLRAAQSELTAGDEVMLSSGIFATVRGVTDDHILVEIADGVTIRVVRAAIGSVLPKDDPTDVATTDATGDAVGDTTVEPQAAPEDVAGAPVDLSKPEEH